MRWRWRWRGRRMSRPCADPEGPRAGCRTLKTTCWACLIDHDGRNGRRGHFHLRQQLRVRGRSRHGQDNSGSPLREDALHHRRALVGQPRQCSANDLQGSYVGQTKDKLTTSSRRPPAACCSSTGNSLGHGHFAQEAQEQLIALCTSEAPEQDGGDSGGVHRRDEHHAPTTNPGLQSTSRAP